jgi:hypothetical protein
MSCERQFADLVSEESGDARRCHWQFQEVDLLVLNVVHKEQLFCEETGVEFVAELLVPAMPMISSRDA